MFIIAGIICCVMAVLGCVVYMIINKPAPAEQPIVSDDIVKKLIRDQENLNSGPSYRKISDAFMGSSPFVINQTASVNAKNCSAICNNDLKCGGFQIHPDGATCDIIASSNIGAYPFINSGWTYYQLSKYTPTKQFSKTTNSAAGGTQVGTTVPGATAEMCSNYCKSNAACNSFTIDSNGCRMWPSDAIQVPQTGTDLYILTSAQATVASFTSSSSSGS